ncbi:MAG: alpha/beta fold hydrolase, partial [Porticoccaceae bacterium]
MTTITEQATCTPQQWLAQGEHMQLLDHSIFVIDTGASTKPTILLLHGFPTSSWDWQPLWQTLAQDYRLIALDMLGFGFSDKPNNRHYTIHRQADFVEALVSAKALKQFHVLAHDYGDT